MLILTRKINESLLIGEHIRIVILEIRGKQVRIGIEAPAGVVVFREEVFQRLTQENRQAAEFRYPDLEELTRALGREMPEGWGLPQNHPGAAATSFATENFGRLIVPEDQITTFPAGLLGVGEFQRYVHLEAPRGAPFGFLQCVDEPGLCFVVAEPAGIAPDFRLNGFAGAAQQLEAASVQDLKALVILTIPPGRPREATANLLCPVLINPARRRGKQAIMESPHYSSKCPVLPESGSD